MDPISLYLENHPSETITSLAKKAGVGYSIVHRTRLLLFDEIPPRVLRFLRYEDTTHDWATLYSVSKKAALNKFYRDYNTAPVGGQTRTDMEKWQYDLRPVEKDLDTPSYRKNWEASFRIRYQSWVGFRASFTDSQMDFAKMFLINPAILQHFESRRTKILPMVIIERLRKLDVPLWKIQVLIGMPVSSGKKVNH